MIYKHSHLQHFMLQFMLLFMQHLLQLIQLEYSVMNQSSHLLRGVILRASGSCQQSAHNENLGYWSENFWQFWFLENYPNQFGFFIFIPLSG